jgi:octaprenyl-diphosphate synthase
MRRYGHAVGLAFQITDDLFDFLGSESVIGKASGTDLEGGKITLPLINSLRNAPESERRRMEALIRSGDYRNGHWSDVVRFVTEHGGVAYSESRSGELAQRAVAALDSVPATVARDALQDAVRYAVTRRR